ncbi:MAG TPA: hypothetical protein VE954_09865 [Oligoflexus sp.]|uniref:hypothetical protein n=1 Tax=Oligoflexus sp. TaxID=1971216 RepID=UPI002D65962B|nr:hypothetical protein [Oligoflexus sp.]HYX33408.1 hypothetical protein [Oligoflexus sp.]
MLKRLVLVAGLVISAESFAWSAISLGGGNWAIICANGTAWSYAGSSAGLDIVGPALCPGGFAAPSPPPGRRVTAGISSSVQMNVVKNLQELNESEIQKAKTYPPHGYPCLGCAPCPGNPTEFCDIISSRVVYVSPALAKADVCVDPLD